MGVESELQSRRMRTASVGGRWLKSGRFEFSSWEEGKHWGPTNDIYWGAERSLTSRLPRIDGLEQYLINASRLRLLCHLERTDNKKETERQAISWMLDRAARRTSIAAKGETL